jgi:hypothetical protein
MTKSRHGTLKGEFLNALNLLSNDCACYCRLCYLKNILICKLSIGQWEYKRSSLEFFFFKLRWHFKTLKRNRETYVIHPVTETHPRLEASPLSISLLDILQSSLFLYSCLIIICLPLMCIYMYKHSSMFFWSRSCTTAVHIHRCVPS